MSRHRLIVERRDGTPVAELVVDRDGAGWAGLDYDGTIRDSEYTRQEAATMIVFYRRGGLVVRHPRGGER